MKENNELKEELNQPATRVDIKRRSFSKAGLSVPVIMTLASQPVLGRPCLSNIISGNLSDPDRGECTLGNSPGGWGAFNNGRTRDGVLFQHVVTTSSSNSEVTIDARAKWFTYESGSKESVEADIKIVFSVEENTESYNWASNIFKYGDLVIRTGDIKTFLTSTGAQLKRVNKKLKEVDVEKVELKNNSVLPINPIDGSEISNKTVLEIGDGFESEHENCDHLIGGDLYSTAFGADPLETDDKPMREILCSNQNTIDFSLVAAMLNAHHYSNYILTVAQVKGLRDGSVAYPSHYNELNDFLDDTWKDI